mgnify:CR=1 FL=1
MTLEELLKKEIEKIKKGKIDERIVSFVDYKNKYAILKPAVKVEVSLTKGVVATIDISDYFEEEVK